ncbi:MAG: CBS domain-containing protein [Myxococcales bacterium]|nr:CBS domain-containing protein [Myxococcales bacterium]
MVGVPGDLALGLLEEHFERYDVTALAVFGDSGVAEGVVSRTDLFRSGTMEPIEGGRALSLPEGCARDIMTRDLVTVEVRAQLVDAARLMVKRHVHRVFARDDETLEGVVAASDVMRALVDHRVELSLADVMTESIVSVQVDQSLRLAAERTAAAQKQALVVLDGEWPVGIVSQDQLLVARNWPADMSVEEWMSLRVLCLPRGMPVHRAASHALAMGVRHVLVMSEQGLVGIATGIDFARAWVRAASKA